jgi:hypothetical protein
LQFNFGVEVLNGKCGAEQCLVSSGRIRTDFMAVVLLGTRLIGNLDCGGRIKLMLRPYVGVQFGWVLTEDCVGRRIV